MGYTSFDDIFKKFQSMVYSIALRYTGNRDDALEVAQESFIKIYKGLPNFRGDSKLSTWIYRITVNQALMQNRGKRKFTEMPDIPNNSEYFGSIADAVEMMGEQDRRRFVNAALEQLNPEDSTILVLYYLEGQSVEEIAQIMRLGESNVKVKLFRGRNRLHEKLRGMLKLEVKSLL